jgi:hypothetical protein
MSEKSVRHLQRHQFNAELKKKINKEFEEVEKFFETARPNL